MVVLRNCEESESDKDGALDDNPLGGFVRTNGSEISEGQLLTSTPEPALIFQTKLSLRVWQGHRGQWVVDICYGVNWLNIGALKTAEGALLSSESVLRFRGGKDLFDYPFFELFVNETRAEPTTTPRTEIPPLQSPPTEEQENPNDPAEGAPFSSESVIRVRGGKDLFGLLLS